MSFHNFIRLLKNIRLTCIKLAVYASNDPIPWASLHNTLQRFDMDRLARVIQPSLNLNRLLAYLDKRLVEFINTAFDSHFDLLLSAQIKDRPASMRNAVAVLARAEETSQGTLSGPPPPTQQQGWCPKPPFRLRGMYGGLGTPSLPLGALSHSGPGTPPG